MKEIKKELFKQIQSKEQIILARINPKADADVRTIKALGKKFLGKVTGLTVSDSPKKNGMSALAAASIIASEGIEPIMHMAASTHKDRITLLSEAISARTLGINNILVSSNIPQSSEILKAEENIFDTDSIELLSTLSNLEKGNDESDSPQLLCLGAELLPYENSLELQIQSTLNKIIAGAKFFITQPLYDLERFKQWKNKLIINTTTKEIAILCGINVFTSTEEAKDFVTKQPYSMVNNSSIKRINSKDTGIQVAVETIKSLSTDEKIKGFEISSSDEDAIIEVIERI